MKLQVRRILSAAAVATALLLGGCSTPGLKAAADFKKADDSGAESDRVFAALVPLQAGEGAASLRAAISQAPELGTALSAAGCPVPSAAAPAAAPFLVPLLATAAQFAFEAWAADKKAEVEALLASAKATYDASILVKDPAVLASSPCIAILRYGVSGTPAAVKVGMVGVLKLRSAGGVSAGVQALQMEPAFLRLNNAVAVTAAAGESKLPVVDVALALGVKATGNHESGLPAMFPSGSATVEVAAVEIGNRAKDACRAPPESSPLDLAGARVCPRSELIPYPTGKGPLSIGVGIAEAGKTGIPGARALAEIDALKAAFGPALAEAVKAHFDK